MKRLILIVLLCSSAFPLNAFGNTEPEKEVLACTADFSADVDQTHGYSSDASGVRFLLTLYKQDNLIVAMTKKYTGEMAGMPADQLSCTFNDAAKIYQCHNGLRTIWYHPAKRHGLVAMLLFTALFKDDRANEGGIYNFTCVDF